MAAHLLASRRAIVSISSCGTASSRISRRAGFEDFVASVADAGDSRLYLAVGDDAGALRRALVRIKHTDAADHSAHAPGERDIGNIAVGAGGHASDHDTASGAERHRVVFG